jgi:hypothetical protein
MTRLFASCVSGSFLHTVSEPDEDELFEEEFPIACALAAADSVSMVEE